MGGNSRRDAHSSANDQQPGFPVIGKLTNFVQATITKLLPGQPRWVKGTVLFLFVFLFIYIVVVTLQGSMVLPIEVRVALTKEERKAKIALGIPLPPNKPAYDKPKPGYQIYIGGYYYGLNGNGHARIDLQVSTYAWIRTTGDFEVTVATPDDIHFSQKVKIARGMGSIFFDRENTQASVAPSRGPQFANLSARVSIISEAVAAVPGNRLYLQALAVPEKVGTENVAVTLLLDGRDYPLQVLTSELNPSRENSLLVKGGTSTVQNYRAFFTIPETSKLTDATIRVQSPSGFFSARYSETFTLARPIEVGKTASITGNRGGTLVLQLAYPVDVVFFERRDTASTTEALIRRLASLGLATRVNDAFATVTGSYNVMYAGVDVPTTVLRAAITEIAAEVPLRRIQTGIKLSNGKQNQIQIGSNAAVSCLPVIEAESIKKIVSQKTDAGFQRQVRRLPRPSTCENQRS